MTVEKSIKCLEQYIGNEAYTDRFQDVCRTAVEALRFKAYFDELYGIGLEVANWHQNGELVSFDEFYEDAFINGVVEE